MNKCEYCSNEFINKGALVRHQKTAKYCLKIQENNIINYTCELCDKYFTRKDSFLYHKNICKPTDNDTITKQKLDIEELHNIIDKQKDTIDEQKDTIDEQKNIIIGLNKNIAILETKLEGKIELSNKIEQLHTSDNNCIKQIALQPKTIQTSQSTNNNTQNILNNLPVFSITKEQLKKAAETDFSLELFLQGQAGVAKFTIGVFRKAHDDKLPWIVSDQARGIFKTKDEDGNIVIDLHAEKITAMVMDAVREKNKEHHDSFYPKRNCNSDDERDEEEIDREGKIELDDQIRADNCYLDILKMNRDNKVFRQKLMKESRS